MSYHHSLCNAYVSKFCPLYFDNIWQLQIHSSIHHRHIISVAQNQLSPFLRFPASHWNGFSKRLTSYCCFLHDMLRSHNASFHFFRPKPYRQISAQQRSLWQSCRVRLDDHVWPHVVQLSNLSLSSPPVKEGPKPTMDVWDVADGG